MPRPHDIHRGSREERRRQSWSTMSWPVGWTVRHVTETASTNADLLRLHAAGEVADHTALAADHQTAGRGRRDRRWDAPPGENLLVSLLFVPVPIEPARLVQRVGLAVVDALAGLAEGTCDVGLKWPNDVLLDGAKVAGILAERASDGTAVVVGVGVNVGWAPAGAARVADLVDPPHPAAVLVDLLDAFDRLPAADVDLLVRYRGSLKTIGSPVRCELPDGRFIVGDAVDVEDSGALVVRERDGSRRVLHAADVVHLRPQ